MNSSVVKVSEVTLPEVGGLAESVQNVAEVEGRIGVRSAGQERLAVGLGRLGPLLALLQVAAEVEPGVGAGGRGGWCDHRAIRIVLRIVLEVEMRLPA